MPLSSIYIYIYIYLYLHMYIYIYSVVFDNGVPFCRQCVRECSRLCVRKWGVQRPRSGNPYFYSVSWVAGAQQLPQEAPEIRSVVLERHAANEASGEGRFRILTCGLRVRIRVAVLCQGRTCPELRGEWVFEVVGLKISMERPKTRDLEKWQNIFVLARPSSFLFFLVARPDFAKNRFLIIDKFSLKPLKT